MPIEPTDGTSSRFVDIRPFMATFPTGVGMLSDTAKTFESHHTFLYVHFQLREGDDGVFAAPPSGAHLAGTLLGWNRSL